MRLHTFLLLVLLPESAKSQYGYMYQQKALSKLEGVSLLTISSGPSFKTLLQQAALWDFEGTSVRHNMWTPQINCVQVEGWHCCASQISDWCRETFSATKASSSSQLSNEPSGHPLVPPDRAQASATLQKTCVMKSLAGASRILNFFPEETIPLLCLFCMRAMTLFFSLNSLQSKSVSLKKFMAPFWRLRQDFSKNLGCPSEKCVLLAGSTAEVQCLIHKLKPQAEGEELCAYSTLHSPEVIIKFLSITGCTSVPYPCSVPCLSSMHYDTSSLWRWEMSLKPSARALCRAIKTRVWKYAINIHTWQHLFSWTISKGTLLKNHCSVLKCVSHKNFGNWVW